jgi:hypothetical protein
LKDIVEYFSKKGFVFKSFIPFDKSLLKTRKKFLVYLATDVKSNYHIVFYFNQKSRFLLKNANELVEFSEKISQIVKHNFKFKQVIIKNGVCSKSIEFLTLRGWKVYNDTM